MGFLGFKTDARRRLRTMLSRARARAKAEAAMAPRPHRQSLQPQRSAPPTQPRPPDLLRQVPGLSKLSRVPDELKNYKKGGVIRCATGG